MRVVVALLLAACGSTASTTKRDFNDRVVELVGTYPAHGFGGYAWPSRDGGQGTTRDLRLGETVIAHGGDGNHCVGVTLEVYWRALEGCDRGPAAVFDASSAAAFRTHWYVPTAGGGGAADALSLYRLGTPVALADARPGDFVQAWTRDQTIGHSMVFLGWQRDDAGEITGIRYWSSQPWTDGIGVSEMAIGDAGWDRDQIHVARAACP